MKFLTQGKVKDLYELDEDKLVFKFSDRVSAFNNKIKTLIPGKGQVLAQFADFWFNKLGIKSHYLEKRSEDEIVVQKLKMIPMECIVRGYYFGSFIKRHQKGEASLPEGYPTEFASKFPAPIFDPTTKDEFDLPVTKAQAIEQGLVSEEEYEYLMQTSLDIYRKMAEISDRAGFILVDLKLEYGKLGDQILLADSIGPDEYRMWPKHGDIKESFDKQILRDWLKENEGQELSPEIIDKLITKYRESLKALNKFSFDLS